MRRASLLTLLAISVFAFPSHARAATNSCPQYEPLLRKHFPAKVVPTMSRIMFRESRCIADAIGWNYKRGKGPSDCRLSPARTYRRCRAVASYDLGLLQANSTWVTVTSQVCGTKWGDLFVLLDPVCNIKVGGYLYAHGGLEHWRGSSGSGM